MRLKGISELLVAVLLVGIVGLGQTTDAPARFTLAVTDEAGKFFAGTTDEDAKFRCTVNFANISKVPGSLTDAMGVLAAVPLKLMFESRPEVLQILGIGNVGALWVSADGFDWERVPRYTVDWTASGAAIDLGTVVVTPKVSIKCEDITQGIKLFGETGEYVHFVTGTCTAELRYEFEPTAGLRLATKVFELPRQVPPAGTWIVVEKVEKGQVTQTYHQSDGKVWAEKEKIVFQRASSLPASAQHCDHFIVKGAGGKDYMYHWWQPDPNQPGRWRSLGEWKPVETGEEGPPQDEGGPPGMG
ncbi:MAG: hypothetical protein BIP78_1553 [Candidatus Bipolaricaulis sibiricus]|uniref:Uncharacterized protein n=1 Tax=Bipolaricaulis sibiricus TaxID=2501609 RepID=A0A410FW64_BIPS1|nr:MAG: hypothetical protein BIP78_1553 [Candidatus Bipolaricaulis sibiricus]